MFRVVMAHAKDPPFSPMVLARNVVEALHDFCFTLQLYISTVNNLYKLPKYS